ncbi:MAG TPA: hypothetical protein VJ044_03905, partial [Candidatus Hodarchaeales archaeon]|nr:hypothetical protein [Candidatus Hodarchaeales archaeon]
LDEELFGGIGIGKQSQNSSGRCNGAASASQNPRPGHLSEESKCCGDLAERRQSVASDTPGEGVGFYRSVSSTDITGLLLLVVVVVTLY